MGQEVTLSFCWQKDTKWEQDPKGPVWLAAGSVGLELGAWPVVRRFWLLPKRTCSWGGGPSRKCGAVCGLTSSLHGCRETRLH